MTKYREEKASEIAIARKKYNLEHKEENEKRCECECGSIVIMMKQHLQSKKHIEFMKKKEESLYEDCME